jgi:hypothetical protein
VPHFTTIASFVSSFPVQIESIFEQVLLVCHQQGLLGNELFAIDGCKLSNAARQWSGTFKELTASRKKLRKLIRQHLQRHRELDSRDAGEGEQQQRLAQTIDTLSAGVDKIGEFLKKSEPRMGKAKKPQEVKRNITDNDSAKMTTSKGTIQGYNGIAAVDGKHQIVIAAKAIGEGQEQHSLQPVLADIPSRFKRLKIFIGKEQLSRPTPAIPVKPTRRTYTPKASMPTSPTISSEAVIRSLPITRASMRRSPPSRASRGMEPGKVV